MNVKENVILAFHRAKYYWNPLCTLIHLTLRDKIWHNLSQVEAGFYGVNHTHLRDWAIVPQISWEPLPLPLLHCVACTTLVSVVHAV